MWNQSSSDDTAVPDFESILNYLDDNFISWSWLEALTSVLKVGMSSSPFVKTSIERYDLSYLLHLNLFMLNCFFI
jgi:hypothetical protein